jgi:hypothetical protein
MLTFQPNIPVASLCSLFPAAALTFQSKPQIMLQSPFQIQIQNSNPPPLYHCKQPVAIINLPLTISNNHKSINTITIMAAANPPCSSLSASLCNGSTTHSPIHQITTTTTTNLANPIHCSSSIITKSIPTLTASLHSPQQPSCSPILNQSTAKITIPNQIITARCLLSLGLPSISRHTCKSIKSPCSSPT